MTPTPTRPKLRQVFLDTSGGYLDLVPAPGAPFLDVPDELTSARLALAILIARRGPGRPGSKTPYRYGAFNHDGQQIAGPDDPAVRGLVKALRGTDHGIAAQQAALRQAGL